MNINEISTFKKWLIVVVLTTITAFSIEVFLMLYGSFSFDSSELVPWTFHWIWEISALICSFIIVQTFSVRFETFVATIIIGMMISGIVWFIIPDSIKIMDAKYYGIESRLSMETYQTGRYEENTEYHFPLRSGFLYEANDPELLAELRYAAQDNEYVNTRGFLFWQTGLAYGFIPHTVNNYNGGDAFLDHVELFFTVGPIVLVESFITGMYSNFLILMLAQIIWVIVKKEYGWW